MSNVATGIVSTATSKAVWNTDQALTLHRRDTVTFDIDCWGHDFSWASKIALVSAQKHEDHTFSNEDVFEQLAIAFSV